MKKLAMIMAVLAVASVASAELTYGGYGISLDTYYRQLPSGEWEYQYDVYATSHASYEGQDAGYYYWDSAMRFEFGDGGTVADHITNMYDTGSRLEMREIWTVNGISGNNGWGQWVWTTPSYGDLLSDTWLYGATTPSEALALQEMWDPAYLDYARDYGFANPFHAPSDYGVWRYNPLLYTAPAVGPRDNGMALLPALEQDHDGDGITDDLHFEWTQGYVWFNTTPELLATIRIVSDLGPYGEMTYWMYSSGSSWTTAVGPGIPEPMTLSLLALGGLAVLRRRKSQIRRGGK